MRGRKGGRKARRREERRRGKGGGGGGEGEKKGFLFARKGWEEGERGGKEVENGDGYRSWGRRKKGVEVEKKWGGVKRGWRSGWLAVFE